MTDPLFRLCRGKVMHARTRTAANQFVYPVFCLQRRMDVNIPPFGYAGLFGVNCRRPVAWHDVDHGARDPAVPPMAWLREKLQGAGLNIDIGEVWLQAFPRVLGIVFNPVSFWFVRDRAGALRVLVADVNNTFGERHQYVLVAPGAGPIGSSTELRCQKVFHVSPFFEVKGYYRFRLDHTPQRCRVEIDYFAIEGEPVSLRTLIDCDVAPLGSRALWTQFLKMPFLTLGVTARILLQAARLWRLRVPVISKPNPPAQDMSHNVEAKHELQ